MPFIPMLISFALKKYLLKSILIVLGTFALAITAAVYFSGFAAFFSFLGILIVGLLLVPVMIVVDLAKMFKVGGLIKDYFFKRKITKSEFQMGITQNIASFFMSEQLGSLFGAMAEITPEKSSKKKDVADVKIKEETSGVNTKVTAGILAAGATGAMVVSANRDDETPSEEGEQEQEISLEKMMSPEMMGQMQAMMQMMFAAQESEDGEIGGVLSPDEEAEAKALMNLLMGGVESDVNEPQNPNVEDVEIKRIDTDS